MLYFLIWVVRTSTIYEVRLFFKPLTTDTIETVVDSLIDITVIKRFLKYLLDEFSMSVVSGPHKVGVLYPDTVPDFTMFSCHHIGIIPDWH